MHVLLSVRYVFYELFPCRAKLVTHKSKPGFVPKLDKFPLLTFDSL